MSLFGVLPSFLLFFSLFGVFPSFFFFFFALPPSSSSPSSLRLALAAFFAAFAAFFADLASSFDSAVTGVVAILLRMEGPVVVGAFDGREVKHVRVVENRASGGSHGHDEVAAVGRK